MERNEVFEKIADICRDIFDEEDLVITDQTTANDVAGWDSLTHLSLINEIEETFDVAFTMDEVSKSKNIGKLIDALMRHIKEK